MDAEYANMFVNKSAASSGPIPGLGHYPRGMISDGTTLVAMEYDGGVVVGTDSRMTMGSYVGNRVSDKITPLAEKIIVCRSGNAADTQAMADVVSYLIEAYSVMEGEPVTVQRGAQIFRKYLYNYREQLLASVLVAGYDEELGGQIYAIPMGGYITRQQFALSGSGGSIVETYLDKSWRKGLARDEVLKLVRDAVFLATHRDGGSGGVIRVADISSAGIMTHMFRPDKKEAFPGIEEPPRYPDLPRNFVSVPPSEL